MILHKLIKFKLRTPLLIFLSSVIFTYTFGRLNLVFLYVSFFTISTLLLCWIIFLIVTNFIWMLFHPNSRESDPQAKLIFQTITFWCVCLIFVALYSIKILRIQVHATTRQASLKNLHSLPYAKCVPVKNTAQKSGVTIYKSEMCFHGLNIYAARDHAEAHLLDMEGNIVHTWSDKTLGSEDWVHIQLCENGDLLANEGNKQILKLNRNSNILWKIKMRSHHDLAVDEEGYIWSLINKDRVVKTSLAPMSILDNSIVVLTPEGKIIKEIPLYDILAHRIPKQTYRHVFSHIPLRYPGMIRSWFANRFFFNTDMKLDIFHTNSVTLLDRDIEGLCKKGDILISVRELDTIAILSRQDEKILWEWGSGKLDRQHHATLLENGNILLFDNGPSRGFSRVIEVNPLSRKIEWEFKAHPPEIFFSATRGACQRLPNGNTLITESNIGRVFEITKDGEIVWEYYTPIESKNGSIQRATVYRMMRITQPEIFF